MSHKLSVAAFLLIVVQLVNGYQLLPGTCPPKTSLESFDLAKFSGLWYEYAKYPTSNERNLKCITAQFALLNSNTLSLNFAGISRWTARQSSVDGRLTVLKPGVFNLVTSGQTASDKENFSVVATDYNSYAVVVECNNGWLFYRQDAWVLTREKKPSEETLAEIDDALDANQLPKKYLEVTDQDACPTLKL